MKPWPVATLGLLATLLISTSVFADAEKDDWFGDWLINHDGHLGTLRIAKLQAACQNPSWCDMDLSYVDSVGTRHAGSVETVDDKWQHIVFYVNFPGNRQKFDAYLFSWDKLNAAGTTYWNGRTFGFSATKTPKVRQPPNTVTGRTILPNGVVEVRYADGVIKQISGGGTTIIFPDGSRQAIVKLDTQAPEPPLLPSDNEVLRTWRQYHSDSLLSIIGGLVADDASAIEMLTNQEREMTLYQKINFRARVIARLVRP